MMDRSPRRYTRQPFQMRSGIVLLVEPETCPVDGGALRADATLRRGGDRRAR